MKIFIFYIVGAIIAAILEIIDMKGSVDDTKDKIAYGLIAFLMSWVFVIGYMLYQFDRKNHKKRGER